MTHTVREASLEHRRSDASTRSIRTAALVAGLSLLAMAPLAGFGIFVTAEANLPAADGTFRIGVLALYLVVVLDVVVAWALMQVFEPVNMNASRLAAWFRLAYAAVFMVAISQLAGTPGQEEAQALLKVDAFNDIWFAGLVLFAAHLVLIGYLAFRSGFVPKVLGVLVVIAGLGYAFDSVGTVLTESPIEVSVVTFIGELLLGIWLVVTGRRTTIGTEDHAL